MRFQFCFEIVFQAYVKLNKACTVCLGNMKEKRKIIRANIFGEGVREKKNIAIRIYQHCE